jgi:hypothetical protein
MPQADGDCFPASVRLQGDRCRAGAGTTEREHEHEPPPVHEHMRRLFRGCARYSRISWGGVAPSRDEKPKPLSEVGISAMV